VGMGISLYVFVVVEKDEVGVGFSASRSRRDKIVIGYRNAGHIAQALGVRHPYARWLRDAVEYEEALDGKVVLYGKVVSEGGHR